jgi:hypothetical protein
MDGGTGWRGARSVYRLSWGLLEGTGDLECVVRLPTFRYPPKTPAWLSAWLHLHVVQVKWCHDKTMSVSI